MRHSRVAPASSQSEDLYRDHVHHPGPCMTLHYWSRGNQSVIQHACLSSDCGMPYLTATSLLWLSFKLPGCVWSLAVGLESWH